MASLVPVIHPTAVTEDGVSIGQGSRVWHHSHLRRGASIGQDCILGKNVFVDAGVRIGDRVKIQNNVSVYRGVELAADVFVGPSAVFTNDLRPRAGAAEWQVRTTRVGRGASVGANATVVCGADIGEHAMVGAGAVVTWPVRPHQLVAGNPARHRGWVCACGEVIARDEQPPPDLRCELCQASAAAAAPAGRPPRRIALAQVQTGAAERDAVLAVLESGNLAGGAKVAEFERAFADAHGVQHAIAVSNGTVALVAALRAHGIGQGDEVITSPLTFVATLNAILEVGATARFADVGDDLNLDPASARALVSKRTAALMPVHLYGLPAPMGELARLADQHGLTVIADAAQAHGARLDGESVCACGTAAFSFYATKNITCGEGGLVSTDDGQIAARLRLLRNHGMRSRYDYEMPGYNYRLTDLQAAIAAVQVTRLPSVTERRAANAARLCAGLADLDGLMLPAVPAGRSSAWHQFTVRLAAGARLNRDELARRLDQAGIDARPYYPRMVHDYACYSSHPRVIRDHTPRAAAAARQVLSLPVHPALTEPDLDRIIGAVRTALA